MVREMSKKEMIKDVCDKLTEKGLLEHVMHDEYTNYSPSRGFGSTLRWLPVENLKKMVSCDISRCKDFRQVYDAWGRAGALRFEPYIAVDDEDDGNPSLVVRRDRFIHMFRGYHFQASGTIDGIGDCGSGAYRMDFVTRVPYYDKLLSNGIITYMLWWAGFIDVGFQFDNFREMFHNNIDVLNSFMNKSMGAWHLNQCRTWSDVEEYIKWETGNIDTVNRTMYQLVDDSGVVFCYMAMGKKTIQIELAGSQMFTLAIPNLNEDGIYNLDDEDELDEFESQEKVLIDNHYIEMLTVMAFKLCGVNLSFHGWWPLEKNFDKMRPINRPGVVDLKSLNEIYKKEPDEF